MNGVKLSNIVKVRVNNSRLYYKMQKKNTYRTLYRSTKNTPSLYLLKYCHETPRHNIVIDSPKARLLL